SPGQTVPMTDLVTGADDLLRCPWGAGTPELQRYHDQEWGRPVGDDDPVFEKLSLEGFQSGLSWLTILRKRDGFRAAFAGFDPQRVAGFVESDVERLVADASIVRHRGKIEATIANAAATLEAQRRHGSLAAGVWAGEPRRRGRPGPVHIGDLASVTTESTALAKRLKGLGFRFVGPTTAYAAMQSLGVVNDHLRGCHVRSVCEQGRRAISQINLAGRSS